jgi:hypothetical protein
MMGLRMEPRKWFTDAWLRGPTFLWDRVEAEAPQELMIH